MVRAGVNPGCRIQRGKLPANLSLELPPATPGLECVFLIDGRLACLLHFEDQPRHETRPFLRHLGLQHKIREVILLSGDRPAEVSLFAAGTGISQVYGGQSPEQKVEIVRKRTLRGPTLYLGDGINDAPAMLNATAGIALGVSSDITAEAAGAVILKSSLASVDELIHIGRRMRRIAITSAVGGMVLSLAGMGAAAAGLCRPVGARSSSRRDAGHHCWDAYFHPESRTHTLIPSGSVAGLCHQSHERTSDNSAILSGTFP